MLFILSIASGGYDDKAVSSEIDDAALSCRDGNDMPLTGTATTTDDEYEAEAEDVEAHDAATTGPDPSSPRLEHSFSNKQLNTGSNSMGASSNAFNSQSPNRKPSGVGLNAMIRVNNLPPQQNYFDLEIIGPDEKALIAIGDQWDCPASKRLLFNVTEANLLYMKRDVIVSKFGSSCLSSMNNLKTLRLYHNDFTNLKNVSLLIHFFDTLRALSSLWGLTTLYVIG